jgi:hypothetical protein
MKLAVGVLLVLTVSVAVRCQSLQQELDEYYARLADYPTYLVPEETNKLRAMVTVLRRHKITNVSEADLREKPRLFGKRMFEDVLLRPTLLEAAATGKTNFYAEMKTNLWTKGFTNLSEEDLRREPGLMFIAGFRVHATLPQSCLSWPPPDTNRMDGVLKFIRENGWNMPAPSFIMGQGLKPLTGLPWSVIADRPFNAYTRGHWLVVLIEEPNSFTTSYQGLLWSPDPQTNQPPAGVSNRRELGGGWYGFESR